MPKPADLKTEAMPAACFAPPLTDEALAKYKALAAVLPPARGDVRDALLACLRAVEAWWDLPASKGAPADQTLKIVHRGKDALVPLTSLTPDLVEKLHDAVPWGYELDAVQALFDRIDPAEKGLRDAAFHLLWFARELCLDREPLSQDKLPGGG